MHLTLAARAHDAMMKNIELGLDGTLFMPGRDGEALAILKRSCSISSLVGDKATIRHVYDDANGNKHYFHKWTIEDILHSRRLNLGVLMQQRTSKAGSFVYSYDPYNFLRLATEKQLLSEEESRLLFNFELSDECKTQYIEHTSRSRTVCHLMARWQFGHLNAHSSV
jgi:hypothetical protein